MTKAIGRSHAAASFLILATFVAGAFVIRSTPAMADDKYGCRGDQACVRIAEKTKCDALCQHAKFGSTMRRATPILGPSSSLKRPS